MKIYHRLLRNSGCHYYYQVSCAIYNYMLYKLIQLATSSLFTASSTQTHEKGHCSLRQQQLLHHETREDDTSLPAAL